MKSYTYSDLDINFFPHPITKDLVRRFDSNAVMQSFKLLLLTQSEEVLMDPNFDGGIQGLLFEIRTPITNYQLINKIKEIGLLHEPRIEIVDIQILDSSDPHAIIIRISYYFLNNPQVYIDNIQLIRTR